MNIDLCLMLQPNGHSKALMRYFFSTSFLIWSALAIRV